LSANGKADVSFIPIPDPKIDIPHELLGVFEFVYKDPYGINDYFYGDIEIYEDNKYWWRGDGQEWGYVIKEDGDYYLLPLGHAAYNIKGGYYIRGKTKIIITENGFSFTATGMGKREFVTIRKHEDSNNLERKRLLPRQ
jgi:hypothetical protein